MNPIDFTPLQASFQGLWAGVGAFVPLLVVAVIIFIVGWVIAALIGRAVAQIIRAAKVDTALAAAGVDRTLARAGYKLDSGRFVGEIVRWFLTLVVLVASLDMLGLTEVTSFLREIALSLVPSVIKAALVLLATVVVADLLAKTLAASAKAAGATSANLIGTIAKWSVWVFGILVVLVELNVAPGLIQTIVTGVVVALSLAFGLSFGLGGKEAAGRYIEKVRHEISRPQQ